MEVKMILAFDGNMQLFRGYDSYVIETIFKHIDNEQRERFARYCQTFGLVEPAA